MTGRRCVSLCKGSRQRIPLGLGSSRFSWMTVAGRWAHAQLSSETNDFMRTLDDLGLHIPFDWPSWDHGRTLAENREGLTRATAAEAAMVIFAIWRSDRFVEGELLQSFETGLIQCATRRLLQAGQPG